MTRKEALRKVKGYLISYLPISCYEEIGEIMKALEEEPFINKPCVSTGVCEHDKNVVLDKIRVEILKKSYNGFEIGGFRDGFNAALVSDLDTINKYRAEGGEKA